MDKDRLLHVSFFWNPKFQFSIKSVLPRTKLKKDFRIEDREGTFACEISDYKFSKKNLILV
jgi:hypothetical protein